jgi:WD40 repeat protein
MSVTMKVRVLSATSILLGLGSLAAGQQPNVDVTAKAPSVRCLSFSPDGKSLAVVYRETNSLVAWDVATRQQKFAVHESKGISALAYAPLGTSLAIGTENGIRFLDSESGGLRHELNDQLVPIRSVAFTPDGRQLVVAGNDRTLKLWNLASSEVQHTFAGYKGNVVTVAVSPNGKWLGTASGRDDVLRMWDLEDLDQAPRTAGNEDLNARHVAFSPDSKYLLIPKYAIINVISGEVLLRFTHFWDASYGAFSADGKWIALVTQYKPIYLLAFQPTADVDQKQRIGALILQLQADDYTQREAASKELEGLGMAPLEQLRAGLNATSAEVRVRSRRLIERLQNAEFAAKLAGHEADPCVVAFSPDSKLLASGDWQGIVKLWSVADAKEIATLNAN